MDRENFLGGDGVLGGGGLVLPQGTVIWNDFFMDIRLEVDAEWIRSIECTEPP